MKRPCPEPERSHVAGHSSKGFDCYNSYNLASAVRAGDHYASTVRTSDHSASAVRASNLSVSADRSSEYSPFQLANQTAINRSSKSQCDSTYAIDFPEICPNGSTASFGEDTSSEGVNPHIQYGL